MTRPPTELSHSRMKALKCPFQYQARYIRLIPDTGGEPALKGRIGHEVAAEYIGHLARTHRGRDLDAYTDIIMRRTQPLPQHLADDILSVGECFFAGFELDHRAERHATELLLAVGEDFSARPDVVRDDSGAVALVTEDLVTGRLDYLATYKGGSKSLICDFKMGQEHLHYDSAAHSAQLQLYAALDFWCNPQRQEVEVMLWGVKYGRGNVSKYTYSREACTSEAMTRVLVARATLDALYDIYGDEEWPATPQEATTCQFCPVVSGCPHNLRLLPAVFETPLQAKARRKR